MALTETALTEAEWPETLANVTSCVYDVRAGRAMALGLPSRKNFRIAYSYWANEEVHTGEYFSAIAVPQGSLFPIRYNPALPRQNDRSSSRLPARGSILAVGVAGSVLLSLVWFLLLRGCS